MKLVPIPSPPVSQPNRHPIRGLCLACAIVAGIWLVLLPWVESWPAVRDKIHFEESRGIDPSAMFYTELDAMEPIAERVKRLDQSHGNAFWNRNAGSSE